MVDDLFLILLMLGLPSLPPAEQKWRTWCEKYEGGGQVADWNMATLLRVDCKRDVAEDNTVIGELHRRPAVVSPRRCLSLNFVLKLCAVYYGIFSMFCGILF